MKYLHLTEDEHGVSIFSDVEIDFDTSDFAPPAPPMGMSLSEDCERFLFLTLPAGWSGDKHPSPRRQVAFCLSGRMRVTAGNGEVREIGPGGIWRMEDTTGSGHHSEVLGEESAHLAVVQLE